jgi:hypothetical protein
LIVSQCFGAEDEIQVRFALFSRRKMVAARATQRMSQGKQLAKDKTVDQGKVWRHFGEPPTEVVV